LLQIGTKGVCDWPANGNKCGNSGGDPTANHSTTLLNEPANVWDLTKDHAYLRVPVS